MSRGRHRSRLRIAWAELGLGLLVTAVLVAIVSAALWLAVHVLLGLLSAVSTS